MLVLSRKVDEKLAIETTDGVITVTVTRVAGEKVALGIEAPPAVRIRRTELVDRIAAPQLREAVA